MLNRNAQYYEWLLPYLEGGLDDARRVQVEARLREDPALAAEAARLRRTVDGLRAAARQPRPENAQVPRDLWPRLRAQLEERAAPAPTPARPAHAWWLTGVGATAAATLALAMIWLPGWHAPNQQDLHPEDHSPKTSVSPPGPGRSAGPPMTPGIMPHAMPTLPATEPKPMMVKKQGMTPAPVNVAAPPAPAVPVTDGADPFSLRPAPATPRSSGMKPTVMSEDRLTGKPAIPTAARSLGMAASHPATHVEAGANETVPGPVPGLFGAPALLPSPPEQNQPASPPRVALASPSPPVTDQVQNGVAVKGQNEAGDVSPAPNVTGQTQIAPQTKSSREFFAMIPLTTPSSVLPPGRGTRQEKSALKLTVPASAMDNFLRAQARAGGFGGNSQQGLDGWQAALSAAMQTPLWGDTTGEQQANQALMAAKESGELDELRTRLEARRAQSPKDLVIGRMLAAVDEFGFSKEAALHERQRVANLVGAVGEDWYALAQAEDHAGNTEAARTAYRHALECPVPPMPYHAGIARARS